MGTDVDFDTGITLSDETKVAWSSIDGFGIWQNVHKVALTEQLDGRLPRSLIDVIVNANVAVDADDYQKANSAFMHGMIGIYKDGTPIMSSDESKEMAEQWIRYNLKMAHDILMTNGDPALALVHFGFASHTLQNTTSPAHNEINKDGQHDFLPWKDHRTFSPGWLIQGGSHAYKEAIYPGAKSHLARATSDLFDIFFASKEMPALSIIDNYGVDRVQPPRPLNLLMPEYG